MFPRLFCSQLGNAHNFNSVGGSMNSDEAAVAIQTASPLRSLTMVESSKLGGASCSFSSLSSFFSLSSSAKKKLRE